jgi:hypothetical protein
MTKSQRTLDQISVSLGLLGLVVGFLIGYGVLSGDDLGRVNLLFVLILFAFLPVLGLVLSLAFLFTGGRKGLVGWILELPILPQHLAAEVLSLGISGSRKSWLFYQTQIVTLSFACGSLLVYFLLLIGSDISFVWRSTLLEAQDLLPVLQVLATPWLFWSGAQPSLELLQQTQDFRLSAQSNVAPVLGQWWKYIFAAQCSYNLLPRTVMLFVSKNRYLRVRNTAPISATMSAMMQESRKPHGSGASAAVLAPVVYSLSHPYIILDWAGSPDFCFEYLTGILGPPLEVRRIEPLSLLAQTEETIAPPLQSVMVLVKSWEPPLAELSDYLCALPGPMQRFILPLDWDEGEVQPIREIHLDEWRRFCGTLAGWQLLQLAEPT